MCLHFETVFFSDIIFIFEVIFNPIHGRGGGDLITPSRYCLAFLNGYTYSFETFKYKKKICSNFNFDFLPHPPSEGGTKT